MMRNLPGPVLCLLLTWTLGSSTADADEAHEGDMAVLLDGVTGSVRVTFHSDGVTIRRDPAPGTKGSRAKGKQEGRIVVFRRSAESYPEHEILRDPVIEELENDDRLKWELYPREDDDDDRLELDFYRREDASSGERVAPTPPAPWRRIQEPKPSPCSARSLEQRLCWFPIEPFPSFFERNARSF